MNVAAPEVQAYREEYESFRREVVPGEALWLRELREAGFARFSESGFPSTRLEDWRFTSVAPIARARFSRPDPQSLGPPDFTMRPRASTCTRSGFT